MSKIEKEDIALREVNTCKNSSIDYVDIDIRRIFTENKIHRFENSIFHERIAINITDDDTKIEIKNCSFKKGFSIRQHDSIDYKWSIYIYKTNIINGLTLFKNGKEIQIDTCIIDNLYLGENSGLISIYSSTIEIIDIDNVSCNLFKVEQTKINRYSLKNFKPNDVFFDIDDLAISDYKRFVTKSNQSLKQVSEIYHRAVLKSATTLKSIRKINFQLMKSTSDWKAIPFGYFYSPILIIIWMTSIVVLYSFIYSFFIELPFIESLYFSVYTFLTIGFGDKGSSHILIKTILVYTEGLLGIVYSAALLTSIINSSRKQ